MVKNNKETEAYTVVIGSTNNGDLNQFTKNVNIKMAEGWIPSGGIHVTVSENGYKVY